MQLYYKKILLVNPGEDKIFSSNEPLNLAFLASFLESKGVQVQIADLLSGEDLVEIANKFKPDIVGITATSIMIKDAFNVASYFKGKNIPTILGGVHATSFHEDLLSKFDIVIKGEGEYPLLEIISEGHDKGLFDSDKVVDINQMPLAGRHLLNNDYYLNARKHFPQDGNFIYVPADEQLLSVMITRGCPWNCAFCHNLWRGLPFRIYTPENVIKELEGLKSNFNLNYFIFRDDNIYSNKKKIKQILLKIIEADLNLSWSANARVDCLDDEILELSEIAGCKKLNFGFESGSQRMLNDLHKKTNIEKTRDTVKKIRKYKIEVSGTFIAGHPNEEKSDVLKTRKLIRELKLDSLGVAIATPFPGTEWWKLAEERKLIPHKINWKEFDMDKVPIKLNKVFSSAQLKKIQRTYYYDAFMANPRYFLRIIMAIITNPATLKRRIKSVLGIY